MNKFNEVMKFCKDLAMSLWSGTIQICRKFAAWFKKDKELRFLKLVLIIEACIALALFAYYILPWIGACIFLLLVLLIILAENKPVAPPVPDWIYQLYSLCAGLLVNVLQNPAVVKLVAIFPPSTSDEVIPLFGNQLIIQNGIVIFRYTVAKTTTPSHLSNEEKCKVIDAEIQKQIRLKGIMSAYKNYPPFTVIRVSDDMTVPNTLEIMLLLVKDELAVSYWQSQKAAQHQQQGEAAQQPEDEEF